MAQLDDADIDALCAHGWLVKDGLVDEAITRAACVEALALASRPGGTSRASTYRNDDQAFRGDTITWLTGETMGTGTTPALATLWAQFDELRVQLNRAAFLGLERFDVQAAHYAGGGARYVRHRDAFRGGAQPNRRLTAIIYLNVDWRSEGGGLLRLYPDGPAAEDVAPLLGRLVVFPSEDLEHEVLPVHASRLALTAWYYGRDGA